ncbi:hypothetical protein IGI04_007350, partial [Brassica rapa subsp. trilocularis]
MKESKSKALSVAVTLKGGTNYLLWSRLVKAAVGSKAGTSGAGQAMREGEGKALTTQHTPGKGMDSEMIRRSDIDALIKALKENGNCINTPLGYSLAASYIDRTNGGNKSDPAHEKEGSSSPDQNVMHNEDVAEERDQNEAQPEEGEEVQSEAAVEPEV